MTYSEAQTYIKNPKKVLDDQGSELEKWHFKLPLKNKFQVSFSDEKANKYILDVFHSDKVGIKMSFHLRNVNNEGLARLDYNGAHTNPSPYTPDVPAIFKPYVGRVFDAESHLHLHVENHGLDWALPIEATEIVPKTINAVDTNQGFKEAFEGFCKYLNIKTDIELEIE